MSADVQRFSSILEPVFYKKIEFSENEKWLRLYIGKYASKKLAEDAAEKLIDNYTIDYYSIHKLADKDLVLAIKSGAEQQSQNTGLQLQQMTDTENITGNIETVVNITANSNNSVAQSSAVNSVEEKTVPEINNKISEINTMENQTASISEKTETPTFAVSITEKLTDDTEHLNLTVVNASIIASPAQVADTNELNNTNGTQASSSVADSSVNSSSASVATADQPPAAAETESAVMNDNETRQSSANISIADSASITEVTHSDTTGGSALTAIPSADVTDTVDIPSAPADTTIANQSTTDTVDTVAIPSAPADTTIANQSTTDTVDTVAITSAPADTTIANQSTVESGAVISEIKESAAQTNHTSMSTSSVVTSKPENTATPTVATIIDTQITEDTAAKKIPDEIENLKSQLESATELTVKEQLLRQIGNIYYNQKDYLNAEKYFSQATNKDLEILKKLRFICGKIKKFKQMIEATEQILQLPGVNQSEKPMYFQQLANYYYGIKNYQKTVDYSKQFLELHQKDDMSKFLMVHIQAIAQKELGAANDAIELLQANLPKLEKLSEKPNKEQLLNAKYQMVIVEALINKNEIQSAMKIITELIANFKNTNLYPEILCKKAFALEKIGASEAAKKVYSSILEIPKISQKDKWYKLAKQKISNASQTKK